LFLIRSKVLDTLDEEQSFERDYRLVSLHRLDLRDPIVVLPDTAIEIEHNQPIGTNEVLDDSVVLRRFPNPDESRSTQLKRLVREMLPPPPRFERSCMNP
jgi:hypothetical protein